MIHRVGCCAGERSTLLLPLRVNGKILGFKLHSIKSQTQNTNGTLLKTVADAPLLEGFPLLALGGRLGRLLLLAAVHLTHVARDRLHMPMRPRLISLLRASRLRSKDLAPDL